MLISWLREDFDLVESPPHSGSYWRVRDLLGHGRIVGEQVCLAGATESLATVDVANLDDRRSCPRLTNGLDYESIELAANVE